MMHNKLPKIAANHAAGTDTHRASPYKRSHFPLGKALTVAMYLSRYVISKESVILEIDPDDGSILRRFQQPDDWEWNPEREKAHWEEYDGKVFVVYITP